MQQLEAVARSIDFIEANLKQPINVADMAEAASYSMFHFCRTFNQVAHLTPYDYLIRRRLSEAGRDILRSRVKILEVALDYQFNNPETFSRAFRRVFQMQPNQLRAGHAPDLRRFMPRLRREHLTQIERNAAFIPQVEDRPGYRLAGRMTLIRDGREAISELWKSLLSELSVNLACPGDQRFAGLAEYPNGWEKRGWFYSALVMDPLADMGWPVRNMPAGRFLRFTHQGGWSTLPLTLDSIYTAWQSQSESETLPNLLLEEYNTSPLSAERIMLFIPLAYPLNDAP